MIGDVLNIQQIVDNHIVNLLNSHFGKSAPGEPWIEDPDNNVKMKYAIVREYRTISPTEVMELVKGQTHSSLGVIIVGNTRITHTPIDILGKRYGARIETMVYNCALNYAQRFIGGDRLAYHMNRDYIQVLSSNPVLIGNLTIPFVLQASESEFADTEMDVQRMITLIPTSINR